MKKIILSLLLVIVVAIAGSLYYVFSNLDDLIKEAIETYGSEATQTSVRVDSVKLKLTEGSGGISGLTIANPDGFTFPNAFSLGETRLGIDLQSLQEEPYIIDEIVVIAPEIYVEMDKDNNTNLNVLKNNLMASLPATDEAVEEVPDAETPDAAAAEPRLIIRKIKFADGLIKAKIAALGNKEYKLKLPSIEMNDLGGSKGLTPTELTNEVISRLSDEASKQVKQKLKDELKAKLEAKKAEIKAKIEAKKAEAEAKLEAKKAEAEAKIDEEKAELEAKKEDKKQELQNKAKDKLKGLFGR